MLLKKICIERDGKIVAAYDVCKIEKVYVQNKESDNIFRTKYQKFYGVVNNYVLEIIECKYASITYNPKTDTFDTELCKQ